MKNANFVIRLNWDANFGIFSIMYMKRHKIGFLNEFTGYELTVLGLVVVALLILIVAIILIVRAIL